MIEYVSTCVLLISCRLNEKKLYLCTYTDYRSVFDAVTFKFVVRESDLFLTVHLVLTYHFLYVLLSLLMPDGGLLKPRHVVNLVLKNYTLSCD